jgi:hypothetical protein
MDSLASSNPQLVEIACKMLMQQVQFLSTYNMLAIEVVKHSEGISNALGTKIEQLAIED